MWMVFKATNSVYVRVHRKVKPSRPSPEAPQCPWGDRTEGDPAWGPEEQWPVGKRKLGVCGIPEDKGSIQSSAWYAVSATAKLAALTLSPLEAL